jgi:hypothetical protein
MKPKQRVARRLARRALLLIAAAAVVAGPAGATKPELKAYGFSATNGSSPYDGDTRLLTTISPNGDGVRDHAHIAFTLSRAADTTLEVVQSEPPGAIVFTSTTRLAAGSNVLEWPRTGANAGTYLMRLTIADRGAHRTYDVAATPGAQGSGTPVVRVLGLSAAFAHASSPPNAKAALVISTDESSLTLQVFRSGPERIASFRDGDWNGIAVSRPRRFDWSSHLDRSAAIDVRVGDWPTGVYFARLTAPDGHVGYAPLIVRPRHLGQHRVAVVLPTNTWQAYNFRDGDGNGVGDTWYAHCPSCTVRLARPFLHRGEPPHYRRYDLPFLHWLAWGRANGNDLPSASWLVPIGRPVDYLSDDELESVTGAELARSYDLIIFPGHHEYVTTREYNAVLRYRNLGGNLIFLSANNFFWRVDRHGDVLERVAKWRDLGRPEAALIGAEYRANDRGERKGPFVLRNTRCGRWLFEGTGLATGSHLTGFGEPGGEFGIEIDATAPSSPAGTQIVAEIPNLYGRGLTAQMTYYETVSGAKVFAAGAFSLGGAATSAPVTQLLDNLWAHLARP